MVKFIIHKQNNNNTTIGGKNTELEVAHSGDGGLAAMCEILKEAGSEIYFGLLRVDAKDESNSVRAKFIYVRFVGTTVTLFMFIELYFII